MRGYASSVRVGETMDRPGDVLRPNPEVLGPRAVVRWVQKCEELLARAEATTDDRTIRDDIRAARKKLAPVRRRALQLLKDADLRTDGRAPPDMFGNPGGEA